MPRPILAGNDSRLSPAPEERHSNRSPLFDLTIPIQTVTAYFHQIAVPAGIVIASGQSAVYVLRQFVFPWDAAYIGCHVDLCATNSTGADINATGNSLAWGSTIGAGAAIIGDCFGLVEQTWQGMTVQAPGIEVQSATRPAHTLKNDPQPGEYAITELFPPGTLADTQVPSRRAQFSTLPGAIRYQQGQTFQICIAIGRDLVNGHAASTLIGRGMVKAYFAASDAVTRWSS